MYDLWKKYLSLPDWNILQVFLLNTLWCCRRTVIDFVKKTAATDSSEVFIVGKCIPMCPMFVSINEDTKAIHIASPW